MRELASELPPEDSNAGIKKIFSAVQNSLDVGSNTIAVMDFLVRFMDLLFKSNPAIAVPAKIIKLMKVYLEIRKGIGG